MSFFLVKKQVKLKHPIGMTHMIWLIWMTLWVFSDQFLDIWWGSRSKVDFHSVLKFQDWHFYQKVYLENEKIYFSPNWGLPDAFCMFKIAKFLIIHKFSKNLVYWGNLRIFRNFERSFSLSNARSEMHLSLLFWRCNCRSLLVFIKCLLDTILREFDDKSLKSN